MQRKEWCKFLNKRLAPLTAGMFCTARSRGKKLRNCCRLFLDDRQSRAEQRNSNSNSNSDFSVTLRFLEAKSCSLLAKSLQRLRLLQIVYRCLSLSLSPFSPSRYSYRHGWFTLAALARHFRFDKCVRRGIQNILAAAIKGNANRQIDSRGKIRPGCGRTSDRSPVARSDRF